jgi:acetamidase/formamidase
MPRTHELPTGPVHYTWDARNEALLAIESGDSVVVTTRDVSDEQVTPASTAADIPALDWDRVYPLAGPIAGGNMDTRQLTAGSTLYLPVQEPRALFSCGDAHAAQGDGEVCVTGIECGLERAVLRFTLQQGRRIPAPQYTAPGPLTPSVGDGGWYATTGVGPDLYRGAQEAVRAMIDRLVDEHGLTREDAYVLASLVVDLRISEIVDAGEYVVSALLPLAVFRG